MCWSYELYNLPHLIHNLYEPFSANYLKEKRFIPGQLKIFKKKIILKVLLRRYQKGL